MKGMVELKKKRTFQFCGRLLGIDRDRLTTRAFVLSELNLKLKEKLQETKIV